MEAAAAGQRPAGARSLGRALAVTHPQEPSSCPPASADVSEARVLVINTGGTIGMVQDVKGEGAPGGAGRRGHAAPQGGLARGAGLGDAPLGGPGLRLPRPQPTARSLAS